MDGWTDGWTDGVAGDGAGEVLERGGDTPRLSPRARRLIAVVVALLAVVAAGLWQVEDRLRHGDERALAGCREVAEAADHRSLVTVGFMVDHVEPALFAVREEARRRGIVALVAEAAQRALPDVERAVATCEEVSISAWHHDLAERREAYLDYLRGRMRWLRLIGSDGEQYYRDRPWLAKLREAAFGR